MTAIFLYGTLRHAALFEMVAGRTLEAAGAAPAALPGYRCCRAAGQGFPLLEPERAARAEGIVLDTVDAGLRDRLDFYESGFGYGLQAVEIETAQGSVRAEVYMPEPGLWQAADEAFSLETWAREHWPLVRHAAEETMAYYGHLPASEMAARHKMIDTRANAARLAQAAETPCTLRSGMGRGEVVPVEDQLSHTGFFLLRTLTLKHRRFDGDMSEDMQREVFVAGDATTVLPYDPVRDRVMLIEQFRMGPYVRKDKHPWMLEPVAGRIDGGESPEHAGVREAHEEAGLSIERLELISRYYASPGYSSEVFHSYLGIADLPDEAEGFGGEEAEMEDIRSHVISFERAMALFASGEIDNAPLIVSLLWLARERDRLRTQA